MKNAVSIPRFFPAWLLALSLFLGGTMSIQSCAVPYNAALHQGAIQQKKTALALVAKSDEAYSTHKKEVEDALAAMKNLRDQAATYKKNGEIVKMWNLMLDPAGGLFAGFAKKWETEGPQNKTFVTAFKDEVGKAFDKIIQLEEEKKKS
ncbi:MAG: hypothetical protein AAB316_19045 [Bacteroidota bacterium]